MMNSKTKNKSKITVAKATIIGALIMGLATIIASIIQKTIISDPKQTSNSFRQSENSQTQSTKNKQPKQSVSFYDTTNYPVEKKKRPSDDDQKVLFEAEYKSTSSKKVLILVEQPNQYSLRPALTQEIISQELFKNGFRPVTESDIGSKNTKLVREAVQRAQLSPLRNQFSSTFEIIILGDISVQPLSDVQGMKIFQANGVIKAVSLTTGLSLGVESFQDVRGFGLTDKQAAENATHAAVTKVAESIVRDILSRKD
jgi:hypothetical protein